jgi:hypothetical protein
MVEQLYGAAFLVERLDYSLWRDDNGRIVVPEWNITCVKPQSAQGEGQDIKFN